MHRLIPWAPALALLLSTLGSPGPAGLHAADVELYRPSHRSAAELAPLVDALLAPEGAAIADERSGTLILRGPRERVEQALETLRSLDVAPRRYWIESQLTGEQELWGRGLEVDAWHQAGRVRIGTIPAPPSDAGHSGAQVVFHSLASSQGRTLRTRLSVLEGHPAEIWTGTRFPVDVRIFEDRDRDLRFLETTPETAVRTGFRVRLRALADGAIELEISQIVEEPSPGRGWSPALVRTLGVATTVRLRPGESLVISGVEGQNEDRLDTRFGSARLDRGSTRNVLWLRVSPEDSDPRP